MNKSINVSRLLDDLTRSLNKIANNTIANNDDDILASSSITIATTTTATPTTSSLTNLVLIGILLTSIDLVTLIGNLLVIIAVISTKTLHTITNTFITSLAVSDLLLALFVMPLSIYTILMDHKWMFGNFVCDLFISSDIMLCTASILNLCCISLDRYFAITAPLSYSAKRSTKLARSMIAVVWIGAFVISCPPVFGWKDKVREKNTCSLNMLLSYRIYSSCGSFFIPATIMIFVYLRIFKVIHDREKYLRHNSSNHIIKLKKKNSKFSKLSVNFRRNSNARFNNGNAQQNIKSNNYSQKRLLTRQHKVDESETDVGTKKFNNNKLTKSGTVKSNSSKTATTTVTLSDDVISIYTPPLTPDPNADMRINKNIYKNINNKVARRLKMRNSSSFERSETFFEPTTLEKDTILTNNEVMNHKSKPDVSNMNTNQKYKHNLDKSQQKLADLDIKPKLVGKDNSNEKTKSYEDLGSFKSVLNKKEHSNYVNKIRKSFLLSSLQNVKTENLKMSSIHHSEPEIALLNTSKPKQNKLKTSPTMPAIIECSKEKEPSTSSTNRNANNSNNSKVANDNNHLNVNNINSTRKLSASELLAKPFTSQFSRSLKAKISKMSSITTSNNNEQVGLQKESKTAKTLAVLVGSFVLAWGPFFVVYVLEVVLPPDFISITVGDILTWIGYLNSSINPIIYAFYSKQFKSAFYRLTFGKIK